MRIAVIGTHGSGKTALVEEFARRNPDYKVIPEIAREMLAEAGGQVDSLYDFELELFWRKLNAEREYAVYPDVITDRTAIDNWAYCAFHRAFPAKLLDILRELSLVYTNAYFDVVAYLPLEDFAASQDEFAGQCAPVDILIRGTLSHLSNVVALTGSVEQRLAKLDDALAVLRDERGRAFRTQYMC